MRNLFIIFLLLLPEVAYACVPSNPPVMGACSAAYAVIGEVLESMAVPSAPVTKKRSLCPSNSIPMQRANLRVRIKEIIHVVNDSRDNKPYSSVKVGDEISVEASIYNQEPKTIWMDYEKQKGFSEDVYYGAIKLTPPTNKILTENEISNIFSKKSFILTFDLFSRQRNGTYTAYMWPADQKEKITSRCLAAR